MKKNIFEEAEATFSTALGFIFLAVIGLLIIEGLESILIIIPALLSLPFIWAFIKILDG